MITLTIYNILPFLRSLDPKHKVFKQLTINTKNIYTVKVAAGTAANTFCRSRTLKEACHDCYLHLFVALTLECLASSVCYRELSLVIHQE